MNARDLFDKHASLIVSSVMWQSNDEFREALEPLMVRAGIASTDVKADGIEVMRDCVIFEVFRYAEDGQRLIGRDGDGLTGLTRRVVVSLVDDSVLA